MRYRISRGVAWSALGLCLVVMSGCCWRIQTVKIINESEFPLTSVRLIPYYENEEAQDTVVEMSRNLLPKDASGQTISLAPGSTTVGQFLRRQTRYIKTVTFYADALYQAYTDDEILDLSSLPANALLVMRVQAGEGTLPCAKIEVACE